MRDALPFASQYSRSGVVVVEGVCVGDVYVTVEVELATLVVVWVVVLVTVLLGKIMLGLGGVGRDTLTVVSLKLGDAGVGNAVLLVVAGKVNLGPDDVIGHAGAGVVVVGIRMAGPVELLPPLPGGGTFKKHRSLNDKPYSHTMLLSFSAPWVQILVQTNAAFSHVPLIR